MLKKITDYITKQSKWFWITILITLIVDAVNSMYFEKIQAVFYGILEGKDVNSMYSLIGVYVGFIVLLIFIGMLSSYENRKYTTQKQKRIKKMAEYLTGIMIFGYGVILFMPSIGILGMGDETSIFTEGQQQLYFGILIALFFTLIVFAFIQFKPRFVLGKLNYLYIYVPILLLATLFVDFSTAMWKFQLFDPEKIADPNRSSRFIEFVAIFPLYALFYSAPRFVLLRKSYTILPVISAILSTMYFVWKSLEYIEL